MDYKIHNWYQSIIRLDTALEGKTEIDLEVVENVEATVKEIAGHLSNLKDKLSEEELKVKQKEFRIYTNNILSKSYFIDRARKWPLGYPGDHLMLENVYMGTPIAKAGIGKYLDHYFLERTLAKGVRERKSTLRELLMKELEERELTSTIMNIGCGSSREIFEIGSEINRFTPIMTFLDYDEKAIHYSRNLLEVAGIDTSFFIFSKFNALKLASHEYTQSHFDKQDVIYSAGLFDYLNSESLIKILKSLSLLLNDGGIIIAPFKDKNNYNVFDYHWLVDWSYFFQRSIAEVTDILKESVPELRLEILPTPSPAINFFLLRKETNSNASSQKM